VKFLPIGDTGHPFMWESTWTLITHPPNPNVAVRLDNDVSQVKVLGMVPLLLDLWPEEADIWPTMLYWCFSWCVTATA